MTHPPDGVTPGVIVDHAVYDRVQRFFECVVTGGDSATVMTEIVSAFDTGREQFLFFAGLTNVACHLVRVTAEVHGTAAPLVCDSDGNRIDIDDAPPMVRATSRWLVALFNGDVDTASALWQAMPDPADPFFSSIYRFAVSTALQYVATGRRIEFQ